MGERTLLLVDDEENILRALVRLLRRDGYRLLTAGGGPAALDVLAQNPGVGVIVSDQRMPEMTGAEFLRIVKQRFPDTVRLTLSGYTDLKSITDAINEGAVYKFLTKPWDDDLLRANIREAFEQYDLRTENARLSVELARANEALARRVEDQSQTIDINERVLEVSRDILDSLPLGVIGVDDDGVVAVANERMHALLALAPGSLVGASGSRVLPAELNDMIARDGGARRPLSINGHRFIAYRARLGTLSQASGSVVVLAPEGES